MIRSFKDRDTERLWDRIDVARFRAFARSARRRLVILNNAANLNDLMLTPSNHFHALRGNRRGQYAIRINMRWRVCFRWDDGASDVEITDYH